MENKYYGLSNDTPLSAKRLERIEHLIRTNAIFGQGLRDGETLANRMAFVKRDMGERFKWNRILDNEEDGIGIWQSEWVRSGLEDFDIPKGHLPEARKIFALSEEERYKWFFGLPENERLEWLEAIGFEPFPPQKLPEEWAWCYWYYWFVESVLFLDDLVLEGLGFRSNLHPLEESKAIATAKAIATEGRATLEGGKYWEMLRWARDDVLGVLDAVWKKKDVFLRDVLAKRFAQREESPIQFVRLMHSRESWCEGQMLFHRGRRLGLEEARERQRGQPWTAREKWQFDFAMAHMSKRFISIDEWREVRARLARIEAEVVKAGARPVGRPRGEASSELRIKAFKAFDEKLKSKPGLSKLVVAASVIQDFKERKEPLGFDTKTLVNLFNGWMGMGRPQSPEKYDAGIATANKARRGPGRAGKKAVGRGRKKSSSD